MPSRASPCKLLRDFIFDAAANAHAIVSERRVELDKRRAGAGKREGVCPRRDTTTADDRYFGRQALAQAADGFQCEGLQRRTGEATLFGALRCLGS